MREWKTELWAVADLKEWDKNPRVLIDSEIEKLKESIEQHGCAAPLTINTDGTICGGHGRKRVLEELGIKKVHCAVPKKKLNKEEFAALNVRLNKNIAGEFDYDKLQDLFDASGLIDLGFDALELSEAGVEFPGLEAALEGDKVNEEDLSPLDDKMDKFLNNTIKQVVLYYEADKYAEILDRLEAVIQSNDLTDNSQAMEFLLDFYENANA